MPNSPYHGREVSEWGAITAKLVDEHPLKKDEIVKTVLKSWDAIFKSNIGSFNIGKEIFPSPQIMGFLLHELVAHYLGQSHPGVYAVGTRKNEKDVHCITNQNLSIEIKTSSNATQIFANRSYAQPQIDTSSGDKNKDGYYITINFEDIKKIEGRRPEILLIRFGYLEHSDWTAQVSAKGQQASLQKNAYSHKLISIYNRNQKSDGEASATLSS